MVEYQKYQRQLDIAANLRVLEEDGRFVMIIDSF